MFDGCGNRALRMLPVKLNADAAPHPNPLPVRARALRGEGRGEGQPLVRRMQQPCALNALRFSCPLATALNADAAPHALMPCRLSRRALSPYAQERYGARGCSISPSPHAYGERVRRDGANVCWVRGSRWFGECSNRARSMLCASVAHPQPRSMRMLPLTLTLSP
jgi:hypothetical protein